MRVIETLSINYEGYEIPVDESLSKILEKCWVHKSKARDYSDIREKYNRIVYRNEDGNLVTRLELKDRKENKHERITNI